MTPSSTLLLLTIRGKIAPKSIEEARSIHNETAGAPPNVAAARSMGDLSHMAFIPAGPPAKEQELLFLDVWNDGAGLHQFFENKDVQAGGARIFASRDAAVWAPAADYLHFELPTPTGRNDRFVGIMRGTVKNRDKARQLLDGITLQHMNEARKLGQISHATYFRAGPPGSQSLELLSMDTWFDAAGMQKFYDEPSHMPDLAELFTGEPDLSIWSHPAGNWVEW